LNHLSRFRNKRTSTFCFQEIALFAKHDDPSQQAVVTAKTGISAPHVVPQRGSIFEPAWDQYGLRLPLVFGNHSGGGFCPYYVGSRCHHCDIGAGEGAAFDVATNLQRLNWFRQHYADLWPRVSHLVLYNSGSVLNRHEMPLEVLDAILSFAGTLSALRVVSLDSREAFIKAHTLIHIATLLPSQVTVRPILGLETADDDIRNHILEKQMPRGGIHDTYAAVSSTCSELKTDRIGIDINIVIAGPGTTQQTALSDAIESARFAFQAGDDHGVAVDLNLHPYYPSARGLEHFPGHQRCSLAVMARAVSAICELRRSFTATSGIFIGWNDEAHDQQPHQRAAESLHAMHVIDSFNRTQDPSSFRDLE
jgi:hypothetical protein